MTFLLHDFIFELFPGAMRVTVDTPVEPRGVVEVKTVAAVTRSTVMTGQSNLSEAEKGRRSQLDRLQ